MILFFCSFFLDNSFVPIYQRLFIFSIQHIGPVGGGLLPFTMNGAHVQDVSVIASVVICSYVYLLISRLIHLYPSPLRLGDSGQSNNRTDAGRRVQCSATGTADGNSITNT